MTITLEVTYPNTTEQSIKDADCCDPDNSDVPYGRAHDSCDRDQGFCAVKIGMEDFVRKYGLGSDPCGFGGELSEVGTKVTLVHVNGIDLFDDEGNELP